MNSIKRCKRILCLLIATALFFSIDEVSYAVEKESSTEGEIKIERIISDGTLYISPNQSEKTPVQCLYADVGGALCPLFLLDDGDGEEIQPEENLFWWQEFNAPSEVSHFLDYFYNKIDEHERLHKEHPQIICTASDEKLKKLSPNVWTPEMMPWICTYIQTVIDLWQKRIYIYGNSPAQRQMLAAERDAIIKQASGKAEKTGASLEWLDGLFAATDSQTGWVSTRKYGIYRMNEGKLRFIAPALEKMSLELPVIGSTGYALVNLPVYQEAESCESKQTVSAGTAFRIKKEAERRWYISGDFGSGWIDHTFCMVNLPDVVPSIVYNITNGSRSMFRSNGHNLEGITGRQLYTGKMQNRRLNRKEYVVPVLYSMAKRIATAQSAALADGDTLVLYEGYRPAAIQEKVRDSLRKLIASHPDVDSAINNGIWSESWFIADAVSNHQRGCAIDVSLAKISGSKQVPLGKYSYSRVESYSFYTMPSAVHELSPQAAAFAFPVSGNNDEEWRECPLADNFTDGAKRLQDYCTEVGLSPLASEWWHCATRS